MDAGSPWMSSWAWAGSDAGLAARERKLVAPNRGDSVSQRDVVSAIPMARVGAIDTRCRRSLTLTVTPEGGQCLRPRQARKFDAPMGGQWAGPGHAGTLAWLVEGLEGSEASH